MNLKHLLFALLPFIWLGSASAVTFDELAGTYVGHRTERNGSSVVRAEEIIVIEADGFVTDYVFYEEFPFLWVTSGVLDLEEDGSFYSGEGQLSLRGRNLKVTVHFTLDDGSLPWTVKGTYHLQKRHKGGRGKGERKWQSGYPFLQLEHAKASATE